MNTDKVPSTIEKKANGCKQRDPYCNILYTSAKTDKSHNQ